MFAMLIYLLTTIVSSIEHKMTKILSRTHVVFLLMPIFHPVLSWGEPHLAHLVEQSLLYRTVYATYSQVSVYENSEGQLFQTEMEKND